MIKLKIDTINHNVILLNAMEDANFTCFKENCLLNIVQLTRKTSFLLVRFHYVARVVSAEKGEMRCAALKTTLKKSI